MSAVEGLPGASPRPSDDEAGARSSAPERWTAGRLVLVGIGALGIAFGAWIGFTTIAPEQWTSALIWLAAGVAVHDGILAPTAVALGYLVLPHVPAAWRAPLRAGALGALVLALFTVVGLIARTSRRNSSVLPVPAWTSITVGVGVLVVAVLVGVVVQTVRGRRAGATGDGAGE